ncbi:TadE/TadG family type IV pilus assembly protein [Enemella evansiae]|nr:TadE/TadG family type IV pilus assembly protein [Enemella evansiae]OYO00799.1 pilus assembly protein TadE [Enemella evansiae]OYO12055.1 pilus assembly protein TadE [Enemella evansiae]PFG69162.1 TadE-like protein [Propionibacteriaceae bacterium ES.041]
MRTRDERGLSESVQWAMLTPVLLLTLLGGIQAGLWWHGRNTVLHAAAAAAEAESALGSGQGAGSSAAASIAAAGGLTGVEVSVRRGAATVDVEVTGRIPLLVDLGMSRVTERASSPVEHR